MKNSKIIVVFLCIAIIIAIAGYFVINYLKNKQVNSEITEEYTPQEEITDSQMKQTMVSLYFYNNETNDLMAESRLVDASELLSNPYCKLVELLIEGPKNEKLQSLMPEGVQVHSATIYKNCVTVDLSQEFLLYTEDKDLKDKMIKCIVKTLTELAEVEKVAFLIDGSENAEFSGEYVRE